MTRPRSARLPLALIAIITLGAVIATPALQDAATASPVPSAHLHQPLGYLLGAPLFGIWDGLSLLTVSQHYAVLATLIGLYVARRVYAVRIGRRELAADPATAEEVAHPGFSVMLAVLELGGAVGALIALLAFYAAAVFLPRPMVGIRLDDPDLVAVDFHSHTNHSHDGWSRFTAARNRAWHEGGRLRRGVHHRSLHVDGGGRRGARQPGPRGRAHRAAVGHGGAGAQPARQHPG